MCSHQRTSVTERYNLLPAKAWTQTGTLRDALALYPGSGSLSAGVWLKVTETKISTVPWVHVA